MTSLFSNVLPKTPKQSAKQPIMKKGNPKEPKKERNFLAMALRDALDDDECQALLKELNDNKVVSKTIIIPKANKKSKA